jgi:endonuclease/exonuclease/phosphatase (EEP) superfamily protein YafD
VTTVIDEPQQPAPADRPRVARRWPALAAWVAAAPFVGVALVRLSGVTNAISVLVAPLAIWLLLPVWPFLAGALVLRKWALGAVLAVVTLLHAGWLLQERGVASSVRARGPRVTVFTANLYQDNHDVGGIAGEIRASNADLVFLQELTPAHLRDLDAAGAFASYPYHVADPWGGSVGSGIFSRWPLTGETFDCGGHPMTRASVDIAGRRVTVLNAHSEAPIGRAATHRWEQQLDCIAHQARLDIATGPTIVAGDFNATYAHHPFRHVLGTGLTDAQRARGAGLHATWPNRGFLFPLVTIDHVLFSKDLGAVSVRLGHGHGSDHRPLVAVLALR